MKEQNRICAHCVIEPYLQADIGRSPVSNERCDYCDDIEPTLSLEEMATRIDTVIENFYTLTSETDAVVHFGRTPEGEPLLSIVSDWLKDKDSRVAEDLNEVLEARWYDEAGGRYGDDPWFIKRLGTDGELSAQWNRMARSLEEEARLVNPIVTSTLESVFGPLLEDRTSRGGGLIVDAGPGQRLDTFYRARVFQTEDEMKSALSHPERELGPRPRGNGTAGRMNANGISVFYGATEPKTALNEVRPPVGSSVIVGAFKVIRSLRLLNLTKLEAITIDPSRSLFDPATVVFANRCQFLSTLQAKLTMPVMPELADKGYLITQAVADFLSTHPRLGLDGIYFRSVQSPQGLEGMSAHNVILFHKASRVLHSGIDERKPTSVTLWEYEDDCVRFAPNITTQESHSTTPASQRMWPAHRNIEPALVLIRDSLVMHEVVAIDVHTSDIPIDHQVRETSAGAPSKMATDSGWYS